MKKNIIFLILLLRFLLVNGQLIELSSFIPAEMDAIEEGRKLGIGKIWVEGSDTAEVFSYQSWKLHYVAGESGMKPGGGIRIGCATVLAGAIFKYLILIQKDGLQQSYRIIHQSRLSFQRQEF